MPFPVPFFRQPTYSEPPAFVQVIAREDVQWNRRVFKAPPLEVQPPASVVAPFGPDPRRNELIGPSR